MGRNDGRRVDSDTGGKPVRIAVLAYPGARRAAVHGLIDLFETASRLAASAGTQSPRILDGRTATTHGALAGAFAATYPNVRLEADRMLIDGGDLLTAGGVMAWIDLGLRLIEHFLTPALMLQTARMFLVDPAGREQGHYAPHTSAHPGAQRPRPAARAGHHRAPTARRRASRRESDAQQVHSSV